MRISRGAQQLKLWRVVALALLTAQIMSLFWFTGHTLPIAGEGQPLVLQALLWLDPIQMLGSAIVTLWLALLLAARSGVTLPTFLSQAYLGKVAAALLAGITSLTALRTFLWMFTLMLFVLHGNAIGGNVLHLGFLVFWGANIFASYQMHVWMVRWYAPANLESAQFARSALLHWLNLSAALTFGLAVLNVWRMGSFLKQPLGERVAYGIGGGLDVLATLATLVVVRLVGHQIDSAA